MWLGLMFHWHFYLSEEEKNAFKTLENIICSTVTCVPSHEQRTLSDWAMVKTLKGVGGF